MVKWRSLTHFPNANQKRSHVTELVSEKSTQFRTIPLVRMRASNCLVLRTCAQDSTAHGITYVINGTTAVQRIVWLIFVVGGCAAFAYYLFMSMSKYYAEETSVKENLQGIAFQPPDMHFCNFRPLAVSRILEAEANNSTAWNNIMQDVRELEKIFSPELPASTFGSLLFWSSMRLDELFRVAGHIPNQSVMYPLRNFEVTWNSLFQNCFRYQPDSSRFRITSDSSSYSIYLDNYHLNKPKSTFLNKTFDSVSYMSDEMRGIMVYFTPRNAYPHQEASYVVASPGQGGVVSVKMHTTIVADRGVAPCQSEPQFVEYHNPLLGPTATTRYVRTLADCRIARSLEKLLSRHPECQCLPAYAPVTMAMRNQYPTCGNVSLAIRQKPVNVTRVKEIASQTVCVKLYYQYQGEFQPLEDCKSETPCTTTSYFTTLSPTGWLNRQLINSIVWDNLYTKYKLLEKNFTRPGLKEYFQNCQDNASLIMDLTQYNFATMFMAATEVRSSLTEESVAYSIENVVGDVGGIAGLFLGMSYLTILELFNLVHDLFLLWHRRQRRDVDEEGHSK